MFRPRRNTVICLALFALTTLAYAPVYRSSFLVYDDEEYVTGNAHVRTDPIWNGIVWAFTSTELSNWHPLTWISHGIDCRLFGMWAGGHHLTNLALHVLNTLLLFGVLNRMTGAAWRSAMVAGLFALHPLHVESVAWVAERKDVLSAALGLAAVWAYVRYVERPGAIRYAIVFLLYLLGLLAKPMLVTLPCVFLLLDYWPLGRFSIFKAAAPPTPKKRDCPDFCVSKNGTVPFAGTSPKKTTKPETRKSRTSQRQAEKPQAKDAAGGSTFDGEAAGRVFSRLILEKIPLFFLTGVFCAMAIYAQQSGGAIAPLDRLSLPARIGNALLAYVAYLRKTFVPIDLGIFYPHSWGGNPSVVAAAVGAGVFLMIVSAALLWAARRRPYLATGWLWYLGMLAPVIGVVQVGAQSMADRYTYLPLIGVFILIVWGAADAAAAWRLPRQALPATAAAALAICFVLTCRQVGYWRDAATLFTHTVEVAGPSMVTYNNLGLAQKTLGNRAEAERLFRTAAQRWPQYIEPHGNLANLLADQGRYEEAVSEYQTVLRLQPGDRRSPHRLGIALSHLGRMAEAEACFREALRRQIPDPVAANCNLATTLQQMGKIEEAMHYYRETVRLQPEISETWNNMAWNNMAWIRATHPNPRFRNGSEAIEFGRHAVAGGRNVSNLDTLAAAYAEASRFSEALATIREALAMPRDAESKAFFDDLKAARPSMKKIARIAIPS